MIAVFFYPNDLLGRGDILGFEYLACTDVTTGGLFQSDGIIAGLDHPFAVVLGRFADSPAVDAHLC
jgi:hypothetical protein